MTGPVKNQSLRHTATIEVNGQSGTTADFHKAITKWLKTKDTANLSKASTFIAQLTSKISEQDERIRTVFEEALGSDILKMKQTIVLKLITEARTKGNDGDRVATCNDLQEICSMEDSGAARSTFSKLWQMRNDKLQGSAGHISQNPNTVCNTLLVDVAKILFGTKTTGEFFQIVSPDHACSSDNLPLSSENLQEALTEIEPKLEDISELKDLSEELVRPRRGMKCRLSDLKQDELELLLESRYADKSDYLEALVLLSNEGQQKLAEYPGLFVFLTKKLPPQTLKEYLINQPGFFLKLLEKLDSNQDAMAILTLFTDSPKDLRKLLALPYIKDKWEHNTHIIDGLVQVFSPTENALWTICGPGDEDKRGWIKKKWHALRPSRLEKWHNRWGVLNDILAQQKSRPELVAAQTRLLAALKDSAPQRLNRTLRARSNLDRTALHWITCQGQMSLAQAVLNTQDSLEAKDKLLRARDSSGHTCIFLAACTKETPSILIPILEALKDNPDLLAKRLLQVERRRKTSALQMAIRTSPDWKAIMQTLEGAFSNRKDLLKKCLNDQRSLFGAFRGWFRSSADDPEINHLLKENLDYKAGRIRRSYRAIKKWVCLGSSPALVPDQPLARVSILRLIEKKHNDATYANELIKKL